MMKKTSATINNCSRRSPYPKFLADIFSRLFNKDQLTNSNSLFSLSLVVTIFVTADVLTWRITIPDIPVKYQNVQLFLNFRGEELGNNFVSHLTEHLGRNGINFFTDKNEERGKDLGNLFLRIKQSNIALAIFSARYSESRWCMEELVKMKKLADKGTLKVIPIFYKVEGQDVRKQTGEFGDNFWTLAKVSKDDEIKKWKDALECISGKLGLSLGEKSFESNFIKEIVKELHRVIIQIGHDELQFPI